MGILKLFFLKTKNLQQELIILLINDKKSILQVDASVIKKIKSRLKIKQILSNYEQFVALLSRVVV